MKQSKKKVLSDEEKKDKVLYISSVLVFIYNSLYKLRKHLLKGLMTNTTYAFHYPDFEYAVLMHPKIKFHNNI